MIIGLTGGIATGKSLVAECFRELGVPVVDSDDIARQVTAIGRPAWRALREAFPPRYFEEDGALDRAAMAETVFTDPATLARLEAILHPAIFAEIDRQVADLQAQGHPLILVVVPLLYKVNAQERFDTVIVVTATPEQQRARLCATRGYTPAMADARMAAQLPLADKVSRADAVIDNTGTPEGVRPQVEALWKRMKDKG